MLVDAEPEPGGIKPEPAGAVVAVGPRWAVDKAGDPPGFDPVGPVEAVDPVDAEVPPPRETVVGPATETDGTTTEGRVTDPMDTEGRVTDGVVTPGKETETLGREPDAEGREAEMVGRETDTEGSETEGTKTDSSDTDGSETEGDETVTEGRDTEGSGTEGGEISTEGRDTEGSETPGNDTDGNDTDGNDTDMSADTAPVTVVAAVAVVAVTVLTPDTAVPRSDAAADAFAAVASPTIEGAADPLDDSSGRVATESSAFETAASGPSTELIEPVGADSAVAVTGKALPVVDPMRAGTDVTVVETPVDETLGVEPADRRLVSGFRRFDGSAARVSDEVEVAGEAAPAVDPVGVAAEATTRPGLPADPRRSVRTETGLAELVVVAGPGVEVVDALDVVAGVVAAVVAEPVVPDPIDNRPTGGDNRVDGGAGVDGVVAVAAGETAAGVTEVAEVDAVATLDDVEGVAALSVDFVAVDADDRMARTDVTGLAAFTLVTAVAVVVDEDASVLTNCDVTGSITSIKALETVLPDVDAEAEATPLVEVNAGSALALSLHRAQRRVSTKAPRRTNRIRATRRRTNSRATGVRSNASVASGD